jgi:NAD(P)-dependent dehydrogenase (short-subunit alcohol dehydrogenase family)
MDSFEGRRIAVVGGSSGIGRATAAAVVDAGGDVVVGSRSDDERRAVVDELGPGAEGHGIDLTDDASVEAFFEFAGPLDGLVCTPAYLPQGTVSEVDDDEVRTAFEVKLLGYRRAVLAADVADDGGVVLVSGTAATHPTPDFFAVGVVNAAVESLARYLALDRAPVRVNVVSPGVVDTWGMPADRRTAVAGRVPVGRVTEPEDVAGAIVAALGNRAMTGTVVTLDGGGSLT